VPLDLGAGSTPVQIGSDAMSYSEYLIRTPLVAVVDQHCTAPRAHHGRERPLSSHQLVFVRRGVFVTYRGRRQAVAGAGQAILLTAGDEVSVSHPQEGGDECTILEFSSDALLDVLARRHPAALDRRPVPRALGTDFGTACVTPELLLRLHGLRRALRSASARGDLHTLAAEDEALHLLDRVVAGVLGDRGSRSRRATARRTRARGDFVEHAKLLLAQAPGRPHTLADLARATSTSPFHLARTFRECVGLPLHQYLLRIRLSVALSRLSEGEENLSTLALDLGFNSHSHFTSVFRRAFGTPPSAARRALQTATEPAMRPGEPPVTELSGVRFCLEAEARCHCVSVQTDVPVPLGAARCRRRRVAARR
jgi:AraC-like DNA-binding protein